MLQVPYMYLRKLLIKDAKLMIEWMHDKEVTEHLRENFHSKTIKDAMSFIEHAQNSCSSQHLAICSDSDEYMGTVSLKHIDYEDKSAEFAIVLRKKAMSQGYSIFGMKKALNLAFDELGLDYVYWCVSLQNSRAIRFYEKNKFREAECVPLEVLNRYHDSKELKWYSVPNPKNASINL